MELSETKPIMYGCNQKSVSAPAAVVMFTWAEAKKVIESANRTRSSLPYTLQTGEYMSYPVTRSYHLGGMGRYKENSSRSALQSSRRIDNEDREALIEDASCSNNQSDGASYVFDWGFNKGQHIKDVPRRYIYSILSSPRLPQLLEERKGLREALEIRAPQHPRLSQTRHEFPPSALPIRQSVPRREVPVADHGTSTSPLSGPFKSRHLASNGSTNDRPQPIVRQAYRFTCGPYMGSTLAEVPAAYLRSLEMDGDIVKNNWDFWKALAQHEMESYRLDFGQHKGKRLDEVPDDYFLLLEQHTTNVGKNKSLQRALWYTNQQLGRSNGRLNQTIEKYENRMRLKH
jgi:uncharacterized protein (DUF3820 family)